MDIKLNELYQEVILDHNRNPRNFKRVDEPSAYSHGVNPLCGDDYHVFLVTDGRGIIVQACFHGCGCAISKASASMMTVAVTGKSVSDTAELQKNFIALVTDGPLDEGRKKALGHLKIFEGVKQFPARVKCATLAWQALGDALKDLGGLHGSK